MADLFRFRCSGCGKLLGVSPRKVGRSVACPRCGIELNVPEPDADEPAPVDNLDDFVGLGIDLGTGPTHNLKPSPDRSITRLDPREADPAEVIAFLERAAADPLELPGLATGNPGVTPGCEADDASLAGVPAPDDAEPEPLVRSPIEPLASRHRRSRPSAAPLADRRRDVVLPRTAFVAWALFAILGLGFSFVAGLMIGHYRWR